MKNTILAPHILRLYTWELLSQNMNLPTIKGKDGDDLIPIVPITDEPDLADSGKSYIIYGFAENQGAGLEQIRNGAFTLRIIAKTFAELGEITTTIARGFENRDRSAAAVNQWSSQFGSPAFPLVGIRFTSLECGYIEGPEPTETEGGPVECVMNIGYQYVTHQEVKEFNETHGWVTPSELQALLV